MSKKQEQVYVKPAPKCMVRDDVSLAFLKDEGEWKPKTNYWIRRIKFKDVIECRPPKTPKPETTAETPKQDDQPKTPKSGKGNP